MWWFVVVAIIGLIVGVAIKIIGAIGSTEDTFRNRKD